MTDGKILYVPKAPHRCPRPEIVTFGPTVPKLGVPSVSVMRSGTVWECAECKATWKVRNSHDRQLGLSGDSAWRRESRRERRKRLGLHWWQRSRS